ncbi:MAG: hypothetical protein M1838_000631 [Thelocarpon superellum]|nr:MAG: hypothetical protein M1838_000631 [Thelocarpon superellum]
MTVSYEYPSRTSSYGPGPGSCLEDKFEVLKDIGDGSFGSVTSARVRSGGAHVARRGTVIAIKTMKKTFESFAPCLELREVIFLRSLPTHSHLVPAYDIFLDPMSKKLHICMEHMDINLYQLMKERDHKCLDGASVKSILYQILSGLAHIHAHHFFHRDIKPENIMVTSSASHESNMGFRRYSSLATPPATPPVYSVKIADFGLARETHSKMPYTTYVSTRWYRAPEVLLRAGEYSAPVDIWAVGAMAVEIATLKPLFPGGNEVDQVWRVCEIMGSPGSWYSKTGAKVGGGDWREGTRLASKLGFSFPKMAPHSIDTILQAPQWPAALSQFVTWCLMWDPRNRPTSTQALRHEYFIDAIDPLRPRSATSRTVSRKQSDLSHRASKEAAEVAPVLHTKSSWFRKSLIGRESAPAVPQHTVEKSPTLSRPSPTLVPSAQNRAVASQGRSQGRPRVDKRATWANGPFTSKAAPMPLLPMLRPISPLSDPVTAQANRRNKKDGMRGDPSADAARRAVMDEKTAKKIGRQLSVASHGNHYAEVHRQEAERALNGTGGLISPPGGPKESFFSHLRKRARRLSGRHQIPISPSVDDVEANAGCGPWSSTRSSMVLDSPSILFATGTGEFQDTDAALHNARGSADANHGNARYAANVSSEQGAKKRHHALPSGPAARGAENVLNSTGTGGPVSARTRRGLQKNGHPGHRYETPDEEDELLNEVITSAHNAAHHLERTPSEEKSRRMQATNKDPYRSPLQQSAPNMGGTNPYPTPSPSAKRNSVHFGQSQASIKPVPTPIEISKTPIHDAMARAAWPTPPYEENEWADAAAASIFAAGAAYR